MSYAAWRVPSALMPAGNRGKRLTVFDILCGFENSKDFVVLLMRNVISFDRP